MWSWLRFNLVATWDWPRVSGKLASLRSRIRGGLTNCEVEICPAAQFLTLRLVTSVSTEGVCVDLDGPGHAPPYLCVSHHFMMRFFGKRSYLTIVFSGFMLVGLLDRIIRKDNNASDNIGLIVVAALVLYFLTYGFRREWIAKADDSIVVNHKIFGFFFIKSWQISSIVESSYDGHMLYISTKDGRVFQLRIESNISPSDCSMFKLTGG